MLQPLEALRSSKAPASKSIGLNYTSLPPQLTIFKALKAGHIVLASVCAMALLANLLATAFAGLFFQDTISMLRPTSYAAPFLAKFLEVDGIVGPLIGQMPALRDQPPNSGAYRGGTGEAQFLVAESNYTYDTPLSFWTDEHAFYQPFLESNFTAHRDGQSYRARTKYVSAGLDCKPISVPLFFSPTAIGIPDDLELGRAEPYNMNISTEDGASAKCFSSADTGDSKTAMGSIRSNLWNRRFPTDGEPPVP